MQPSVLGALFPADDFSLIAVILGMPLLGAIVNGVWGRRLGKSAVRLMALTAVGVSLAASIFSFVALHRAVEASDHEHAKLAWTAWQWMHTTGGREGANVPIELRFSIDALSSVMMLVVTGVGFLIHLYSTSYMAEDKAFWRFFAYLNLFIFSMLVLILADNLPVLFVGWEGVGLCSYLLIGFWYEKLPSAAAGKKAFIANRIGDVGLLCAMFLLVYYTGALDWNGIASGSGSLVTTSESQRVHLWPLGGGTYQGIFSFLQPKHPFTISAATAVGLALLLGCTGKSAQIPLYVWLPDAMAGPTPVSALIHAATMVTAGVYLICRLSFIFVLSPFTMATIACVGAGTALFAATIALVQNDIKKVLAYSTISQLGFMFLGVGVGAFTAGFFHVFTHAFFKACLFLGAGSVIHGMHARIHDDDQAQDMRMMGGLRRYMPLTFWTFAAATVAIIGLPLTSGFFSKDEILYRAFVNHSVHPETQRYAARHMLAWHAPQSLGPILYGVGVLAATLTAFYMCRALFLTFFGEFRGWKIGRISSDARSQSHSSDGHHAHDDLTEPGRPPHESPWQMTVPLIILGAFSLFAGVLNMGPFHFTPMEHWLEPVFKSALTSSLSVHPHAEHLEWPLMTGGLGAFVVGTAVAYYMYIARNGVPAHELAARFPRLHRLLLDKWRVDELYENTVIAAVDALAETAAAFDQWFVDGILARVSVVIVSALGTILRAFQNGVVHVYAAAMVVGVAAMGWFFIAPHAEASVTENNGDYTISAAPGVGYTYQWDADGNGKPDSEKFSDSAQVKVHLDPGTSRNVNLAVANAFGFHTSKSFFVSRPQPQNPSLELGQN